MNREGIIRIVFYSIIVLILLYFSIGYSFEVYRSCSPIIDVSGAHDIVVDDTDFSPLVMLLGYGVNGVLLFITQGLYAIIILIVSALFFLPFRFIGLNKKNNVTLTEYAIYKYSFIGALILSLIISAILTKFTGLLMIVLYNGIWAIGAFILVILPAKRFNHVS
ncbi:MAG: hypothetical protein PUF12_02505 [Thermoflexaceae bacterium]|nr:hypothetical protein [Thermoflexaceae bacterium]